MRPERWWSVIITMGLFMALSPLGAQARPNRPFAQQPNRQAFTRPQPRVYANGWNSRPRQWQPPRRNAYGWNGQNRPPGNAYGWNDRRRQWDQHRNAYRQNDYRGQWNQHNNAYGANDHQRQWQQPHPSFAQGDRSQNRQFQPPNGGQPYNPGSPYNRAGYPAPAQSPNIAPRSSGYSHNTAIPAGQTGVQPISQPNASGYPHRPQGNTSVGGI
jgi:hypothetical protein